MIVVTFSRSQHVDLITRPSLARLFVLATRNVSSASLGVRSMLFSDESIDLDGFLPESSAQVLYGLCEMKLRFICCLRMKIRPDNGVDGEGRC